MAKCLNCGKSTTLRGRVKLIDGDICVACFKSLGFDPFVDIYNSKDTYKWDEIKVGKSQYEYTRKAKHRQWLKEHPEFESFLEVLDEDPDAAPDEVPDEDPDVIPF